MSNTFEIRKEIELEATPDAVWAAVATPEGQAGWSPDPYAAQAGADVHSEPKTRFRVRTPQEPDGGFHEFEYIVEPRDGGVTALTFVHSGYLGDHWEADFDYAEVTGYGWDMYLHTLAQYLKYFEGRSATFVTAQGPPESATVEAWGVLEQALGVETPVALGQEIQLTPAGLPPITGVVDYVDPTGEFLAVRADDGLYRFHGMALMGMPIAVGHYIYADTDRAAAEEAWTTWLERLFR